MAESINYFKFIHVGIFGKNLISNEITEVYNYSLILLLPLL
jgi:hypothetical protein